jgi:hypothetical protein
MTKAGGSEGRQAAVTVAALAAAATETYSITDADAAVGDIIVCSPNTAPEAGFAIECCYVNAAGAIRVRVRNISADALTGGALTLNYQIIK